MCRFFSASVNLSVEGTTSVSSVALLSEITEETIMGTRNIAASKVQLRLSSVSQTKRIRVLYSIYPAYRSSGSEARSRTPQSRSSRKAFIRKTVRMNMLEDAFTFALCEFVRLNWCVILQIRDSENLA